MSNVISLSKGEKINLSKMPAIDLSKGGKGLQKVIVGLGWDPVSEIEETGKKKGLFGSLFGGSSSTRSVGDIDCDAFAVGLNEGRIEYSDDTIYFGHLKNSSGSIKHTGDNLTGDGDGDDEQIIIDLSAVRNDTIVIGVNIYQGNSRNQHFGMLQNAFIRIEDMNTGMELCRYTLDSQFDGYVTVNFGSLIKSNNEWTFVANGEPSNASSIGSFVDTYK